MVFNLKLDMMVYVICDLNPLCPFQNNFDKHKQNILRQVFFFPSCTMHVLRCVVSSAFLMFVNSSQVVVMVLRHH